MALTLDKIVLEALAHLGKVMLVAMPVRVDQVLMQVVAVELEAQVNLAIQIMPVATVVLVYILI
jgi:hypothetical protein